MRDLGIYRVLHAMDRLDPASAAGAVRTMERDRRGGVHRVAEHLHAEGRLREDVTVDWAADVLWTVTSFESLDLLITDRGLEVDQAIDTLVTIAERTLLRVGG